MPATRLLRQATATAVILLAGCQDRALEIAEQAADRQAAQNQTMAQLQEQVAAGTHELLAAETTSRQDHLLQSHALAEERSQLHGDWQDLEAARTRAADARRRDAILVTGLKALAAALATLAALAFAWLTLFGLQREPTTDPALDLWLLEDLVQTAAVAEPQFGPSKPPALSGPPPEGSRSIPPVTDEDPPHLPRSDQP